MDRKEYRMIGKKISFEASWAQNMYPAENCGTCRKFCRCKMADGDNGGYPCPKYRKDKSIHKFVEVK